MKWSGIHKFLIIIGVLTIGMIWQTMSALSKQYPLTNFPPKGTNIVALGDSLTVGIGASGKEGGFIPILEQRFNITIINKGVSGNTTSDALARLDSDVLSYHPDIVMILLGSNDYLRQEPRKDTFKNLHTMITRIQEKGAVVILLGARGGALSDTFAKDFATLARSTGSAFVPSVLDGIFGNTKLMADEIHPNNAGYLKMADKIAPVLEGIVLAAPAQIKQ
jgi:lysophospholipase L1-like esterase